MDAWLPIQQLADSNIVGIVFAGRDGLVTDANDEFLRIIGYSRAEMNAGGVNWIHITPAEWALPALHAEKLLEETGKVQPFEKEYIRKDGTRVPVMIALLRMPPPSRQHLCFVMDLSERKRVERDLDRMLIERFALLDSAGDGIYGVDLEGRCTFINAAATRMLGYDASECQGLRMHDLVHGKHADGSNYPFETCPIVAALRDCAGSRIDNEVLWRKDGVPIPVEYSCQPIVVGGRVEGAVVSFADISKRKLAERRLRASEERFRSAFTSAAAGMYITDCHGRYLEVNQAYCRFTGYSESELLRLDFAAITHPDDVESSRALLQQLLAGLTASVVTERRYIKKDGSIAWGRCSVAALTDADGKLTQLVGILEDITGQKKAQADLRDTEGRYRSIVENSQEGICMCDLSRRITYHNARLAEMLGYPDEKGLACGNMHYPEDEEELRRRFERRKAGIGESYGARLRRADGSPVWVNCSAGPIPDEHGDFCGAVCMFADVTEQKLLEAELQQARKLEASGQSGRGSAEHLGNLLTHVLDHCGIVERSLAAEDPALATIAEVREAAARALSSIQKRTIGRNDGKQAG